MSAPKSAIATDDATDDAIDVHDAAEVLRCCEELGVTELELRDAIREVGPGLAEVKRALAEMVIHHVPERHYDDMPAEEGGKIWEQRLRPVRDRTEWWESGEKHPRAIAEIYFRIAQNF